MEIERPCSIVRWTLSMGEPYTPKASRHSTQMGMICVICSRGGAFKGLRPSQLKTKPSVWMCTQISRQFNSMMAGESHQEQEKTVLFIRRTAESVWSRSMFPTRSISRPLKNRSSPRTHIFGIRSDIAWDRNVGNNDDIPGKVLSDAGHVFQNILFYKCIWKKAQNTA